MEKPSKVSKKNVSMHDREPVLMGMQYDSNWQQLKQILAKHWRFLHICLKIAVSMVPYPQLVARLAGNLPDHLVHSEFILKLQRSCLMDFPKIREFIHVANARYVLLYISPRIVATGGSRK